MLSSGLESKFHVCQRFSPVAFQSHLRTAHLGRFLLYRTSTESTQSIAKREILEGAPTGTIVVTETQTRGRGRVEGRSWVSSDRGNLMFTLVVRPKHAELFALNLALAASVADSITRVCGVRASVKWPNDVWIGGQKVAGILIDADFIGSDIAVAAGVGINVNEDWTQVDDSAVRQSGTSILTALRAQSPDAPQVNRELLLATICNRYEELLMQPFPVMFTEYRSYDCLISHNVTVMPKRREDTASHYTARAVGFSVEGFLLVQRDTDDKPFALIAEEVTVRLSPCICHSDVRQ